MDLNSSGVWKTLCDDQGYDLEIRYQQGTYELRWYPQEQQAGNNRFALADGGYSEPFPARVTGLDRD